MEGVNTLSHTLYEKGAEAFNSPCSQSQQSAEPRPITGCAPSPGAQGWWLLSQAHSVDFFGSSVAEGYPPFHRLL